MEEILLPKEIEKLAVENFYDYIRTKALRFLEIGVNEFRESDAFQLPNYEISKKTLALFQKGCFQVTNYRGLTPETAFDGLGIPLFYKLLGLFHYKVEKQRIAFMAEEYVIDEMFLVHIVTGQKMRLYNKVKRPKTAPLESK